MSTGVLFIGLDSAEPGLLRRWMDDGSLPCLAGLVKQGRLAQVDTCPAIGDGAFWPSLYTGVNPARHGRYFLRQIVPGSYREREFDEDRQLASPPFWKQLSDTGRRVAVIDVFRAALTPGLNGLQLADWYVHGTCPGTTRSWPPGFAQQTLARYGKDPFDGRIDSYLLANPDIHDAVRLLEKRIKRKTKLCVELLLGQDWDLFFTVFSEAHDIGHVAWHRHDPLHPLFDPAWSRQHADPVRKVYMALDASLGELVDSAGKDTHVVLMAGLGMEPACTANYVLDSILLRLEQGFWGRQSRRVRGLCRRVLRTASVGNSAPVPRSQRRCYSVPHNEHAGAIRLNIAGREPAGRLRSAAEVRVFCDWLEKQLGAIRACDTGEPLVRQLIRSPDVFSGGRLCTLPDLFVVWNREKPFTRIASPVLGQMRIPLPQRRTGDHSRNAVFGIFGQGCRGVGEPVSMQAEDIAPTVCRLLGFDPGIFDGRVVEALLPEKQSPPVLADIRPLPARGCC